MKRKLIALLIIVSFFGYIDLLAYDYSQIPGSETYRKANSVLALSEKSYLLDVEGGHRSSIHLIRKILNQKGKRKFAEYKITYCRDFQEVEIINAQTINQDGSIDVVKKEEINDMDHPMATKAPRYPEVGILVVSFPSVDVGDVLEISYAVKTNADFPLYGRECFRLHEPLLEKVLIIEVPEDVTFHFNRPPAVGFSQQRIGKGIRYIWRVEDMEEIVEEECEPPLHLLAPTLYYSNIPGLQGFLCELHKRMVEKALVTPEIKEKAEEIIGGSPDEHRRVKRLFDFVNGQVNSTPLGLKTISGFMSDATTVLRDSYGNSWDKSILLYALLQSMGLAPGFVFGLGSSRLKLYEEALKQESFSAISRPLVRVRLNGEELYLDPMLDGGQYGPLGIGADIDESQCYSVQGERASLEQISTPDRLANVKRVRVEMQIAPNGDAYMVQREEYSGIHYAKVKKIHQEFSPKKLEEYAQKKVDHISRSAIPTSDLETKELPYKFVEGFRCRIPHYAIVDGDFLYLDLGKPITEGLRDFVAISTKRRYNPYFNPDRKDQTIDFQVKLPVGYEVCLTPGDFEMDLPSQLGKISYERLKDGDSVLSYKLRISVNEAILPREDYAKLYAIREEVAQRKYGKVLLRKE